MFQMRMNKPEKGNKFYNTRSNGGYSTCIQGYPTDKGCNVLANCVGYACGRFNEIIGEMQYPSLNCNAEDFITRAKKLGLEISDKPTLGGIMVWASSYYGHVAIVERIDNEQQIYTSESSWNGPAFFNATRNNNNGRWGLSNDYTFIGCIINPSVIIEPTDEIKVGDWVEPIELVNYYGTPLTQYDDKYKVTEIDGDRAVCCAERDGEWQVWASMNVNNLRKVDID